MSDLTTITYLTGTKQVEPTRYRTVSEWSDVERFFVDSGFYRVGPFDTRDEARWFAQLCKRPGDVIE
jgi:hypothetical protein